MCCIHEVKELLNLLKSVSSCLVSFHVIMKIKFSAKAHPLEKATFVRAKEIIRARGLRSTASFEFIYSCVCKLIWIQIANATVYWSQLDKEDIIDDVALWFLPIAQKRLTR